MADRVVVRWCSISDTPALILLVICCSFPISNSVQVYLTEGVCGTTADVLIPSRPALGLSGGFCASSVVISISSMIREISPECRTVRQLLDLPERPPCEPSSGFAGSGSFNGSVKDRGWSALQSLMASVMEPMALDFSFSLPMVSTMLEVICMVEEVFSFRCSTDSIPVWIAAVVPVASALIWSECEIRCRWCQTESPSAAGSLRAFIQFFNTLAFHLPDSGYPEVARNVRKPQTYRWRPG